MDCTATVSAVHPSSWHESNAFNNKPSFCLDIIMADEEEAPPAPKWNASSAEDAPAGPFNEEGLPHGHVRPGHVPLPFTMLGL